MSQLSDNIDDALVQRSKIGFTALTVVSSIPTHDKYLLRVYKYLPWSERLRLCIMRVSRPQQRRILLIVVILRLVECVAFIYQINNI